MTEQKSIIVGMSGGVDSSVAAALLVAAGHKVTGAFMKNWSDTKDPLTGECSWKDERRDAMAVASELGIPFVTFDFEKEYRDSVVSYMVEEYRAGRTPNPDVMCNKAVKFDLFLRAAREMGADAIATGHYARVSHDATDHHLLAGVDMNKDQSYFLHQLTQEQLSHTLFPIGHLEKPAVRALAREFKLPTADKKDSQGICFIGKVNLREFLAAKIPPAKGPIETLDGKVVGQHDGVAGYTIGQRHGFGGGGGAPYFVVAKDIKRNALIVAHDGEALYAPALVASNAHWIAGTPPMLPLKCKTRIRYRQPLQEATVHADGDNVRIEFAQPQRAITPGQFVVFYSDEECMGGAVIDRPVR